jgi:hypothetical protein
MFHREVWPVRLATRNLAISARYVGPGRAVPEFSLTSVPRVPRPPHALLFRAKPKVRGAQLPSIWKTPAGGLVSIRSGR